MIVLAEDQIGQAFFWDVKKNAAGAKNIGCVEPGGSRIQRQGRVTAYERTVTSPSPRRRSSSPSRAAFGVGKATAGGSDEEKSAPSPVKSFKPDQAQTQLAGFKPSGALPAPRREKKKKPKQPANDGGGGGGSDDGGGSTPPPADDPAPAPSDPAPGSPAPSSPAPAPAPAPAPRPPPVAAVVAAAAVAAAEAAAVEAAAVPAAPADRDPLRSHQHRSRLTAPWHL